ncbi:class I SAM-dependent methyltransferase [Fertoebacter nigrum]|uniref:Class I SAM-dependent methyltransferase n=1 Tax=Fertoeibacter niger TaxID=2656921 RepID=A0A8X8KLQ2_9RHOB|nr:class I SAM-dependent methyltransferase [Fertoeibacter niger]NUB43085.1 class I SAM-dependent methyltransferase [Fertoeibacter niger]
MTTPDDILPTYEAVATGFDRLRDRSLFEAGWLARMLALAPGRRVLDLGCGTGRPIAQHLVAAGAQVTGVDGAAAMLALFRQHVPQADALLADMRGLQLGRRFDAVLAFDSFFHLSPADQRPMFATFAAHSVPRAVLLFTSGPRAGEPVGEVDGAPVYHASLDPDEYRILLAEAGFTVLDFVPEDPQCRGRSVWLAQFSA